MDGIIAYTLSKKYTDNSLIGMGALKGAPCQVQSINKVDGVTTITLKWKDDSDVVHTQSFEIDDGLEGVGIVNATIKPNGNLELTLSNGNTIDCGKVLPQYSSMPTPSASNEGQILQYIGDDETDYTNGYFYKCIEDNGVYIWSNINTQDSYTKEEIGDLGSLPEYDKNIVENISDIDNLLRTKQDIIQVSTLPVASASYVGKILQYIGETNFVLTNGYYYQCKHTSTGYVWEQKDVQPNNGGGGSDNVIEGYFNAVDNLFYEESSYVNPINGEENVIYISLDTNLLYRYDGNNSIFIRVDYVEIPIIQYSSMPIADSSNLGNIVQYIGTTTANYTNGYFYKSVFDDSVYKWININVQSSSGTGAVDSVNGKTGVVVLNGIDIGVQASSMPTASASNVNQILQYIGNTDANYTNGYIYKCVENSGSYSWERIDIQPQIVVDSALSNVSENPVQNKVIKLSIDQLQGSLSNKVDKIVGKGLSENDFTDEFENKLDNLVNIKSIGTGLNFDTSTGELTATGASIQIDSELSETSIHPVQNKVITLALEDKIDKVSNPTNGDFVTFDSNGELVDSAINSNIIPNTATSSNKLATANDVPNDLGDLGDVSITSPDNSQILAYNSVSGKWENKTGQSVIGGTVFKGSILFNNIPITGMENGDWYDIKDAFTTDNRFEEGSGISCAAGTDIIWVDSDSKWNILTPSGVYSFNGRTGAVVPASGDYSKSDVGLGNVENTGDSAVPVNGGTTKFTTGGAYTELNKKVDKVASATNGNLAGLNNSGNLTDSGISSDIFPSSATSSNKLATANDIPDVTNYIAKSSTAGLVKNDGTIDTTSYVAKASSPTAGNFASLTAAGNITDSGKNSGSFISTNDANNFYNISDTAETSLADNDYIPFYDTSATSKRKTLWSNIKSVLKTYFDSLYAGKSVVSTTGNGLAPMVTDTTKFLKGDGTWATPEGTSYDVVSKQANGLAPQLPNETTTTKFLRQDGTWQVPNYPTVNNATLTIQKNGTDVQTFTANSNSSKTANIITDEWLNQSAQVQSDNTVTFDISALDSSYAYDLYCENKLVGVTDIDTSVTGYIKYTVSGASAGDYCKLRIIK